MGCVQGLRFHNALSIGLEECESAKRVLCCPILCASEASRHDRFASCHSSPRRASTAATRHEEATTEAPSRWALYNWALWLFIAFLTMTQFEHVLEHLDVGHLSGSPVETHWTDSSRFLAPMTSRTAIGHSSACSKGDPIGGYCVVKRDTAVLVPESLTVYAAMCSLLAITIDEVLKTCLHLGYNVAQDSLRLVDDLNSKTTYQIQQSLPILIMPFWDNCGAARSAILGNDGSACMLRLEGAFMPSGKPLPVLKAVNRTIREVKTVELLQRPGRQWKNGWYEDLSGSKWYSDVISTNQQLDPDIVEHQSNMLAGEALGCSNQTACEMKMVEHWGSKFSSTTTENSMTSVAIANGERYGLFQYEEGVHYVSASIYDWEMLLSNVLTTQILFQWMLAMAALQREYFLGVTD